MNGVWTSEAGSTVDIVQAEDGTLSGNYFSKVGVTEHHPWPLRGIAGNLSPTSFGFAVAWEVSNFILFRLFHKYLKCTVTLQ
jgi:hypothetical protein